MLRNVIDDHIKAAETALAARLKVLTEKKLDEKARKRDVVVRKFQAVIRKYKGRIKAHDKVAAVNADLVTRRAERAAAPKVKKEKKKAAAPKPKEKQARKPKAEKAAE